MAVDFGPTNHFGFGAKFHTQRSVASIVETVANILDISGNSEVETGGLNTQTDYEQEVDYDASTPDIAGDLGTILTQCGDLHGSGKMTDLSIEFRAGEYAKCSARGHQHAEVAHTSATAEGYADVSAAVPASAGFGVPTLTGQTIGSDASPIALTIRFSMAHVDRIGTDGNHFAGKSVTFRADLTETFLGIPTTPTATGWTTDSLPSTGGESNVDFTESTYTAHRYFDLTA